jgi:predicted DNA-binding protein YlxM (UPF0122 family)
MDASTWNLVLSAIIGLMGWVLKDKSAELKRIEILLNKTREEVAKEYVTKMEVHSDINRVLDRLDRLEGKLDTFMKEQRSALG